MAFWFKSECHSNRWLWVHFNTVLKHHHTFIFNCMKNTKAWIQFLGGTEFLESPQRKQIRNKCNSTKSEPSPQNTTGRNTKILKILQIISILLATSVRKNWKVCRNECNKTWGSYNMHLAFLTLLIREIQMFCWWDNNRLFWIILYIYIYIYIWTLRNLLFQQLIYFLPQ